MKNIKWSRFFIVVVGVFMCSACNGTVTREIRHSGFSLSNTTFICDSLTPKDDSDTSYKKLKYLGNTFAITEDGSVYELSLGQKYSNNQNCKKADFSLEVVSMLDNKVLKASDGNLYYASGQAGVAAYSLVTVNDNSYSIYQLLLGDGTNLKAITVDSGAGIYYVLKNDGNVYQYTITRPNIQADYQISSTNIVYDSKKYGNIIDFNYSSGAMSSIFLRTDSKFYRMKATNREECSKYADVSCKYEMAQDEALGTYYDKILGYNGSLLITTYGKEFTALG